MAVQRESSNITKLGHFKLKWGQNRVQEVEKKAKGLMSTLELAEIRQLEERERVGLGLA